MDKQLEEKIRERAYEIWMRHGSVHGRAEEYWYQAEREILGDGDEQEGSSAPLIDPAPLGMTSMTMDEEPPAAPAPKTRKKRTPAAAPVAEGSAAEGGETPAAAPKRRRTTRAT